MRRPASRCSPFTICTVTWDDFGAARRRLAAARGLVIDLRDAAGSDPRALPPWLAEVGGRVMPPRARSIAASWCA